MTGFQSAALLSMCTVSSVQFFSHSTDLLEGKKKGKEEGRGRRRMERRERGKKGGREQGREGRVAIPPPLRTRDG